MPLTSKGLSQLCPWCKHLVDASTDPVSEHKPKDGDVSLCFYCGEWCVYTDELELRKPTDAEFNDIAENDQCRRIREAWSQLMNSS